jgi:hypothetical protein
MSVSWLRSRGEATPTDESNPDPRPDHSAFSISLQITREKSEREIDDGASAHFKSRFVPKGAANATTDWTHQKSILVGRQSSLTSTIVFAT